MWWLDRFGLPPQVVDEMPAHIKARIPPVTALVDQWRQEQEEQARKGHGG